jgi:hypothetical protein
VPYIEALGLGALRGSQDPVQKSIDNLANTRNFGGELTVIYYLFFLDFYVF